MPQQWQEARPSQNHRQITINNSDWQLLPLAWFKCNINAIIFKDSYKSSVGCILRDATSSYVTAMTTLFDGIGDHFMAEALGMREALSQLKKQNYNQVFDEFDALDIVKAIYNDSLDNLSIVGMMI